MPTKVGRALDEGTGVREARILVWGRSTDHPVPRRRHDDLRRNILGAEFDNARPCSRRIQAWCGEVAPASLGLTEISPSVSTPRMRFDYPNAGAARLLGSGSEATVYQRCSTRCATASSATTSRAHASMRSMRRGDRSATPGLGSLFMVHRYRNGGRRGRRTSDGAASRLLSSPTRQRDRIASIARGAAAHGRLRRAKWRRRAWLLSRWRLLP
jgi:hypothetical protein